MRWVDVAGPPGSGKSTLCDPLWHHRAIGWDGILPPAQWHDFLNEVTRLFLMIKKHPTIVAALRMNNRSIRKMATVSRMVENGKPYVQTGLVQRGTGFGWRMNDMGLDLNELRHYFRLMPVSLGVAVTRCPQAIVEERNHARKLVPATAHEDRAHMVGLMQPAIEIALEVLRERGIPVLEVNTNQPVDNARAELVAFTNACADNTKANGSGDQAQVLSPPGWWE